LVTTRESLSGRREVFSGSRESFSGTREILRRTRESLSGRREVFSGSREVFSGRRDVLSGRRDVLSGRRDVLSDSRDMTATLIQSSDRVVLQNISWQTYPSLIADVESEPAIGLTYNCGTLEIRMPLDPHQTYKKLLGRFIEAATEELDLEMRSLGSRPCDREDLQTGLEPDQCYRGIEKPVYVWLCAVIKAICDRHSTV
jgi:hypothetical protein